MRTIRRQVYVRDRRLALLQLRQGKCRCAATVRTSAGCPRRVCASPILRTFRPVVARISRKPYFGLFEFPAFALHHLLFCVATKITWSLNRIAIGREDDLEGGRLGGRLGGDVERLGHDWHLPGGARDGKLESTPQFADRRTFLRRLLYSPPGSFHVLGRGRHVGNARPHTR